MWFLLGCTILETCPFWRISPWLVAVKLAGLGNSMYIKIAIRYDVFHVPDTYSQGVWTFFGVESCLDTHLVFFDFQIDKKPRNSVGYPHLIPKNIFFEHHTNLFYMYWVESTFPVVKFSSKWRIFPRNFPSKHGLPVKWWLALMAVRGIMVFSIKIVNTLTGWWFQRIQRRGARGLSSWSQIEQWQRDRDNNIHRLMKY